MPFAHAAPRHRTAARSVRCLRVLNILIRMGLVLPITLEAIRAVAGLIALLLGIPHLLDFFGSPFQRAMLFQMLVAISALGYAVRLVLQRHAAPRWTTGHSLLVMSGIMLVLTAVISIDPSMSFFGGWNRVDSLVFMLHAGLYVFLVSWTFHETEHDRVLQIAIGSGLVTIVLSTVTVFLHPGLQGVVGLRHIAQYDALGNANFTAHLNVLLMALTWRFHAARPHWWTWAAFALFAAWIFLTSSLTAIVLALGLLLVTCWRSSPRLAMASILAIAIFTAGYAGTHQRQTKILLREAGYSVSFRIPVWRIALATTIREHPIVGYGWGNAPAMWSDAERHPLTDRDDAFARSFFDRTHNILVEQLVAGGLLNLLAFLVLITWFIGFTVARALRTRHPRDTALAIAIGFHALILLISFDSTASLIMIGLIAGFILHDAPPRRRFSLATSRTGALSFLLVASSSGLWFTTIPGLRIGVAQADAAWSRSAQHISVSDIWSHDTLDAINRARSTAAPYRRTDLALLPHLDSLIREDSIGSDEHVRAWDQLVAIVDEQIELHPSQPRVAHEHAGRILGLGGTLEDAKYYLERALLGSPRNVIIQFDLSQIAIKQGDHPRARQLLSQLEQRGALPGKTEIPLAVIEFLDGNLQEGNSALQRGRTKRNPTDDEWNLLAAAYRSQRAPLDTLTWLTMLNLEQQNDPGLLALIQSMQHALNQ
jgi:O-antigen ligase